MASALFTGDYPTLQRAADAATELGVTAAHLP
jgi:hypothetical protein